MEEFTDIATEEINTGLIQQYIQDLPDKALRFGIKLVFALLVLFVGIQLIKLVRKILKKSLQRGKAEPGVVQFLDSLTKISLYVLLLFTIATNFGLDTTSVIAVLGSAGVAIGLAIQGSLSNFAGGVLILLLKPFRVGDYIMVDNGSEGTVHEIQLFYTKLLTPDNHVVIITNGTLSNSTITNLSMLDDRRLDIAVGISYRSGIKEAREVILAILFKNDKVLKDKECRVFVSELADSSVMLNVRCWTKNEDYWETKWDLTENIKLALDEAGVEIPFPQMDVHLDSGDN